MKQKIILTALPNGIVSNNGVSTVQVSAAISLQVEDVNTTLQNVPDMLKWAEKIKTGTFKVYVNGQQVAAKVTSKEVDAQLWKDLFAPTVKVRSFIQEDLSNMPILSYPVKHIVTFVKEVVAKMGNDFATDLPDSTFYTNSSVFKSISDYSIIDYPKRGREKFTRDNIVRKTQPDRRLNEILRKSKAIPFSPSPNPTIDFAQLKNFHGLYNKKEVKNFKPVPKPDFEFHDILSIIAAYPDLLRKLGLIFDFEFPANLIANPNAEIRIAFTGVNFSTATTISCPATAYTKTQNGFYTRPVQGSLIDKGHLKLNTDAFTVFQLDTDGAGLKLCQMIDALQLKKGNDFYHALDNFIPAEQMIPVFNNAAPTKEGLPVNRTTGIGVAKNGMADSLQKKFIKMNGLKPALVAIGVAPTGLTGTNASFVLPNETLYADDLNLGYRMDVLPEDKGGKWFSLHKRNNKYSFINSGNNYIDIPDMSTDEGYIQIGAAEDDTTTGKQLKVGETLARWEGWSLSVPPVGSALNEPMLDQEDIYDKSNPSSKIKEANKYKTPLTQDFKLNVTPSIPKGTLPMLRFGKKYAIKIRTVDVAGNSVDLNFNPENAAQAIVPNIRYLRYEPADAPFLLLGNKMKDGESSERMVIRSNENITVEDYEKTVAGNLYLPDSVRHVKPPRCTVERATTHAMLDKGFGDANAAQAATYYQKIIAEKDPLFKEEDNSPNLQIFDPTQKTVPVEYLADPMAAGVTFFISNNDLNPKLPDPEVITKRISFYFDQEVTTDALANKTNTTDEWFNPQTFRIELKEGNPAINWDAASRTLKLTIQKGAILKLNYACFWRPDDIIKKSGMLEMMGLNHLNSTVGKRIARGQHWMFSPWREITFVHAVQQPLSKVGGINYPQIVTITPDRNYGDNFSWLHSKFLIHGPSTGQFDLDADWQDWIDDVNEDALEIIDIKAKVYHFTTPYLVFEYVFGMLIKNNPFPALKHTFNDTKHRFVNYHSIATTRYREYFFKLIDDHKNNPGAFKLTTQGSSLTKVNILSSARPVAPQVEYVIPTFEWDRKQQGNNILTARVSGLRIYLKRPWYSSGEGEQLAVVLHMPQNNLGMLSLPNAGTSLPVTTWGKDPARLSAQLPGGITPGQSSFVNVSADNKDSGLSIVEIPGAKVNIVAYDVKYDTERQLYYADIMLNIAAAYYPFIRLSLAAYQKHSVRKNNTDVCLSPLVQPDYIQIPAPRASSLQFGFQKNIITVGISGSIDRIANVPFNRSRVEFICETIDFPASEETHISLNKKPILSHEYMLTQNDIQNYLFHHSNAMTLPPEYATKPYRVKVLEYELITYDPLKPNPNPGGSNFGGMPRKERLVFADVYEVNV